MRKINLLFCIMCAIDVYAQSDFPLQFADEDGNIIANGTTLYLTDYEMDDFGIVQISSGLYVKNITSENVQAGGNYTIKMISNGTLQTCFPNNCMQRNKVGTYFETGETSGNIAPYELKSMQTEWLREGEGQCTVTYQLLTFRMNQKNGKWMEDGIGPEVTLMFMHNTTDVNGKKNISEKQTTTYYDVHGIKIDKPLHGMYIVKTVDLDGKSYIYKSICP